MNAKKKTKSDIVSSETDPSPRRRRAAQVEQRDRRDAGAPLDPRSTPTPSGMAQEGSANPSDDVGGTHANGTDASKAVAEGVGAGASAEPTEASPESGETLSPDMKTAFLRFRKSQLAQRSSRVALALSQFMRIRLPYPRQIEAMAEIEELRLLGREMRGDQQLALNIFNRTGTGKSTIASQYKLMRAQEDPEGVQSVVHARLGTSGSARDLFVSIMSELGDGFASSGTEHTLRRRAMKAMEDAGTDLLILDEAQHSGQKSGFSREVTAELKVLLDVGHVPIVLLGTEDAVKLVGADRELSGRMFSPCRLDPLSMYDEEDFALWSGFLSGLDQRMVSDGIVASPAGLADEDLALALGDTCEGVIGQLTRIMTMALRNTIRDRRDQVTIEDISIAVDEWSMELGFAKRNLIRDL